ncbi:MAG: TVP38/TMEM64 family protein [Phycisphaerales bacterium JB058]
MTDAPQQPESAPASSPESEVRFSDFGRAGPAAIVAAFLPALGGFILLGSIPVIAPKLRDMGTAGLLLYVAVFALTSGFAILPTFAQAALGGYAFGLALGLPGALCGFLGGSLIGYFLARGVTGDDALRGVQQHPKWNIVVRSFFPDREGDGEHRGFWRTLGIITLIRFPPNSPFAITNLVLASVKVDLVPFVIGTALGMLPRTAVVAYLGTLVEGEISKDALSSARPGWYLPVGIAISVAVLLILARLGDLAIKKAVARGEIDTSGPEENPGSSDAQ